MRIGSLTSALLTRKVPYYVHYGVTHRCNLTCRMCGIWKTGDRATEMKLEQIRAMARNLHALGTGVVSLGGGEPLLRDDLPEIIQALFEQKIELRLLTNGYTRSSGSEANARFLDRVFDTGLRHVSISLDTVDPRRFADICEKDDVWAAAVETMGRFARTIADRGGVGNLNCVVSRANLGELERVVDLAERFGFWVSFIPIEVHEYGGALLERDRATDMYFGPQDHAALDEAYGHLMEMKKKGRHVFSTTPYLEESLRFLKGEKAQWKCLAGSLYFSVSPEGRFSVCHRFEGTGQGTRDVKVYEPDFPDRFRAKAFRAECRATAENCRDCVRPCWTEVALAFTHPRSFMEMAAMQVWRPKGPSEIADAAAVIAEFGGEPAVSPPEDDATVREIADASAGSPPAGAPGIHEETESSPANTLEDPALARAEQPSPQPAAVPGPAGFPVVLVAIYSVESAGLRYLSATLKRAGFPTTCVFLRDWRNNCLDMPTGEEFGMVLDIVRRKSPGLVGLGFTSSLHPMAKELTLRLKSAFPHLPVLWGGIHPTSVPEECIQDECDMLCIGEGEEALLELAERMAGGLDYGDVRNIWVKRDGEIVRNPCRPLLQDLDWLPYPDIDADTKYYIEHGRCTNEEPWLRTAEYRMYFSRGCPYNCSYCYVSILREVYDEKGKRYYRHRSVQHVIGEIEHAMSRFKRIGHVKVDDDTSFAFGKEWIEEFCREWKARVNLPFECMLIPAMLRKDLLVQLKDAGLFRLQTGIESGSAKESREIFNRAPGNKAILEFAELNRELQFDVIYDVIIDNPSATEEMKLEMAWFLLELPRPYKIYFYSLTYFPGTALTRDMLAKGLLHPDQVEGRGHKAWKQFRVSMDWPRSDEDRFYLAIYSLASKSFVPKSWIASALRNREGWKRRPWLDGLYTFAWGTNLLRMVQVAWEYWRRGDLTWFKIRQYADIRKLISQ